METFPGRISLPLKQFRQTHPFKYATLGLAVIVDTIHQWWMQKSVNLATLQLLLHSLALYHPTNLSSLARSLKDQVAESGSASTLLLNLCT